MHKLISSTQNSYIKELIQLKEKSRNRRQSGLFITEGQREIGLALEGAYTIETLLYCPELLDIDIRGFKAENTIEITRDVYQKLAHRQTTEGLIAVLQSKPHELLNLSLNSKNPLILVAEAPEKPGNIGALLRTADAANIDAVIIANPRTDLYNPNIIRSSVGCLFTTTIATGSTKDIIDFLKKEKVSIYCATLQASTAYHTQDYTKASALVVGTEADGLGPAWLESSDGNIIIPMSGKIDSMNVSVAAGILIFEAKRQRGF